MLTWHRGATCSWTCTNTNPAFTKRPLLMIRSFLSLSLAFLVAFAPAAPAATKESSKKKSTTSSSSARKKTPSSSTPKKRSTPVEAYAVEEGGIPKIRAASAIVIDANTGKVLHEVNADDSRPVASTQKLLTALIVAEDGGMDTPVKIQ
ncbi:MAG: hypothetical protein EOP84_24335, partial [Verrucomicrobiaceae bacterium]